MKFIGGLALGFVLIHSASATVLYSTFGPNDTYHDASWVAGLIGQGAADLIYPPNLDQPSISAAVPFTVPGSSGQKYQLTSIELVANAENFKFCNYDGQRIELPDAPLGTLSIHQNQANLPGASIFSMAATPSSATPGVDFFSILSFSITTPVTVEAGSTYWLTVIPEWYTMNALAYSIITFGDGTYSNDLGATWRDWSAYGTDLVPDLAFRVSGELAPVPEPSTCLAGAAMLGMMGLIQWRRAGKSPKSGN